MEIIGCVLLDDPYGKKPSFESHQMEIVDVAPHLANVATFAVYEDIRIWCVTNLETGRSVGYGVSRYAALKNSRKRLASKTEEDFESAFTKFPKEFK